MEADQEVSTCIVQCQVPWESGCKRQKFEWHLWVLVPKVGVWIWPQDSSISKMRFQRLQKAEGWNVLGKGGRCGCLQVRDVLCPVHQEAPSIYLLL